MESIFPTAALFRPRNQQLMPWGTEAPAKLQARSEKISQEIKQLISQKNYPCVAALKSYHQEDYQVGLYGSLGSGESWRQLRNDLLFFLAEQKKTSSIYLTFWAVFEPNDLSEEDFEQAMWRELSFLTSEEDMITDWPEGVSTDPADPTFRFALGGSEFFVVGLHSNSSRQARRFSAPTLIFNVFDQFEQLKKLSQYDPMVAINRKRDEKFQGSVNPMVALHGEEWESIQFSGKENPKEWRCPFHFLKRFAKP